MSSITKIACKINCLNDIMNALRESNTAIIRVNYDLKGKEKSSSKLIEILLGSPF